MNTTDVRWPESLWAAATPPGPDLPELIGTQQADVIVIGAGFTGLSTALHLREAGVDVAIVEAAEPGWGASGRNNGQVIPTLSRPDPDDIIAKHGEVGERFVGMLRDSASAGLRCVVGRVLEQDRRSHQSAGVGARSRARCAGTWRADLRALAGGKF